MTTVADVLKHLDRIPEGPLHSKALELRNVLERFSPGTPLTKDVNSLDDAMTLKVKGMVGDKENRKLEVE